MILNTLLKQIILKTFFLLFECSIQDFPGEENILLLLSMLSFIELKEVLFIIRTRMIFIWLLLRKLCNYIVLIFSSIFDEEMKCIIDGWSSFFSLQKTADSLCYKVDSIFLSWQDGEAESFQKCKRGITWEGGEESKFGRRKTLLSIAG